MSATSSPVLSKPLACWLLAETSDAAAIATIAASPILRSEATMALPALRIAFARPATHDEIMGIIGSRFATFPQPQRDVGEAAAFWADYFKALEDQAPAAIEAGMVAHVNEPDAHFLPKPGRLRELARTMPNNGRWSRAYRRAKAAVTPAPVVEPESNETREAVKRQMTDLFKTLNSKATAKADAMRGKLRMRPTPSAAVDSRGVSDEMRRLLRSQGANIDPPVVDQDHYGQEQAA